MPGTKKQDKRRAALVERISKYVALIGAEMDAVTAALKADEKDKADRRSPRLSYLQRQADKLRGQLKALPPADCRPTPAQTADEDPKALIALLKDYHKRMRQISHQLKSIDLAFTLSCELYMLLNKHTNEDSSIVLARDDDTLSELIGRMEAGPAAFTTHKKDVNGILNMEKLVLQAYVGIMFEDHDLQVSGDDLLTWHIEGTSLASLLTKTTATPNTPAAPASPRPASPSPTLSPPRPSAPPTQAWRRREASQAGAESSGAWTLVRKPPLRPRERRHVKFRSTTTPSAVLPLLTRSASTAPKAASHHGPVDASYPKSTNQSLPQKKEELSQPLVKSQMPCFSEYNIWMEDDWSQPKSAYGANLDRLAHIVQSLHMVSTELSF